MSGAAKIVVAITMSATKTLRAVPERVLEAFLFTTTSTRLGSNLSGGELRRTTGVRGVRLGRGGANDIYYELIKKYQVIVDMSTRPKRETKPPSRLQNIQYRNAMEAEARRTA